MVKPNSTKIPCSQGCFKSRRWSPFFLPAFYGGELKTAFPTTFCLLVCALSGEERTAHSTLGNNAYSTSRSSASQRGRASFYNWTSCLGSVARDLFYSWNSVYLIYFHFSPRVTCHPSERLPTTTLRMVIVEIAATGWEWTVQSFSLDQSTF